MQRRAPYVGLYIPRSGSGSGHLSVAGKDSSLTILSSEHWDSDTAEFRDLHGTLSDGRKASLIACIQTRRVQHRFGDQARYETSYFPHYIIVGETHVGAADQVVRGIHYHFENVGCFVTGSRTFGSLRPDPSQYKAVLEADHVRSQELAKQHGWELSPFDPEIGDHPELLFFSGVREIVKVAVDGGTLTLGNRTSRGSGSGKGVAIENEIVVSLVFSSPKTLREAVNALVKVHGLFELCLGRRQRYRWIEVELTNPGNDVDGDPHGYSELFWSYCNEGIRGDVPATGYADILLHPERRKDEFSTVAAGWLNSSPTMGEPRHRFATAFYSRYGANRIVGAANMFDLLPESRAPKKREPDLETKSAVDQCKSLIKQLPDSFAKQAILSALGRVGTASLRDKVCHRADVLISASGDRFAEIHLPCSQAVLCRNHYVHGSEAAFDYAEHFNEFAFLTDTLEFVFATSDLIELGWDYEFWRNKGTSLGHDFGAYALNFAGNLSRLKALLSQH